MTLVKGLLVVLATTTVVHAQTAPAAEALFRDGRNLIQSGDLERGCNKLAASEKLDSSVGTLLNLGDCREKLGQTATAWAAFRKAEAMAKRDGDDKKRQTEAQRRADRLEKDLSRIVIQVGTSTSGVVIKRDGEVIDPATLNTPIPVDPGSHVVVAEAPNYKPFKTEVSIGKGGRRYVVVPSLERIPDPATAPIVMPDVPAHVVVDRAPRYITVRETWSGARSGAVVLGVLGAAALGGGIYFGIRADDLQSQSDARCPTDVCDDAEGLRLNDDAQTHATRANIFLLSGGATVGVATLLWFLGAPDERTVLAPTVGSDRVGAALVGRF